MLIIPNPDQKIEMMIIPVLTGLKAELKEKNIFALGHSISYRDKQVRSTITS